MQDLYKLEILRATRALFLVLALRSRCKVPPTGKSVRVPEFSPLNDPDFEILTDL